MTVPDIKILNRSPEKIIYCVEETIYGPMMIGACDEGICWAGFDIDGAVMRARFAQAQFIEVASVNIQQSLAVCGTPFQISVWRFLLTIAKGRTQTYGDIAKYIQRPNAHRAVGSAVGANPISGFIPCHRVVPSHGGVGHYLWGTQKKAALLNKEALLS